MGLNVYIHLIGLIHTNMRLTVILPIIPWFVQEIIVHLDPKFVDSKHQMQESIKFYLLLQKITKRNDLLIAIVVGGDVRQHLADIGTKKDAVK